MDPAVGAEGKIEDPFSAKDQNSDVSLSLREYERLSRVGHSRKRKWLLRSSRYCISFFFTGYTICTLPIISPFSLGAGALRNLSMIGPATSYPLASIHSFIP